MGTGGQSRRALFYGAAAALTGGLCFAGFVYKADADVETLLGSADIQLRLAYGMPETDKAGRPLAARETLVADIEKMLDIVDRQRPDMAVSVEFRGFTRRLRGDYAGAAALYRKARSCGDCTADQRQTLVFNEARMLVAAGDGEGALRVFATEGRDLPAHLQVQRAIEEAQVLRGLERNEEAERRLDAAGASIAPDGDEAAVAWLQAGLEYDLLGAHAKAESAFERAAARVPIADYHLARLKLRAGRVEESLTLLERAGSSAPAETKRLIDRDRAAWQAVAGDARFEALSAPRKAPPGR